MKIKPTMSMFVTIEDLNAALVKWYEEENDALKHGLSALYSRAMLYVPYDCEDEFLNDDDMQAVKKQVEDY